MSPEKTFIKPKTKKRMLRCINIKKNMKKVKKLYKKYILREKEEDNDVIKVAMSETSAKLMNEMMQS